MKKMKTTKYTFKIESSSNIDFINYQKYLHWRELQQEDFSLDDTFQK